MTYYFAWVDPGTAFDSGTHNVEHLSVFAFELQHIEGEFPELMLDVKNEGVSGLLGPSRKQWAWFSHFDGVSTYTPLFYGRLVGIPQDLQNEIVRYQFVARPTDFEAQKTALADALKVAPYWDRVFIPEDDWNKADPALEAYPLLWHIDRTTHVVSTSNIIEGEDGTENIAFDYFYDSLQVSYSSTPLKTARVTASVSWAQVSNDVVDITPALPSSIKTLTGPGLYEDWPEPGDSFGRYWTVETTDPGLPKTQRRYIETTEDGFDLTGPTSEFGLLTNYKIWGWATAMFITVGFYEWSFHPRMTVRLDLSRDYVETLTFDLDADIQPLVTDAGDDDIVELDFSGAVDVLTEDNGSAGLGVAIEDRSANRYFDSSRGQTSIKYLIARARAAILFRARAIDINFQIPIEDGFGLSCRKSATIADTRLPGGTATGKIKAYLLTLNGDTGEQYCQVTLGATLGQDGTVATAAGTPTYAEAYVDTGYQVETGATFAAISGEVTYTDPSGYTVLDDGVSVWNLTHREIVEAVTVYNNAQAQRDYVDANNLNNLTFGNSQPEDAPEVTELINQAKTEIEVDLISFNEGPFETPITLTTSVLKIPKTIDLEAT